VSSYRGRQLIGEVGVSASSIASAVSSIVLRSAIDPSGRTSFIPAGDSEHLLRRPVIVDFETVERVNNKA
jgi:hypothetical protein